MDDENQVAAAILVTLGVLAAIAGSARLRYSTAPLLATWAVLAGWLVLVGVTGVWVASCPGCTSHTSYDSSRYIDLFMAIIWGGFYAASLIAVVWVSAGVSTTVAEFLSRAKPERSGTE